MVPECGIEDPWFGRVHREVARSARRVLSPEYLRPGGATVA
jgi:hypothetical protein